MLKNGYYWAKTPDGELFVLLNVDGMGFVPAVESAIDLATVTILEPIKWPSPLTTESRVSDLRKCGAPAAVAAPECVILPFAASA